MSVNNNSIQAINKKLIELLDKQKYQVDPFQREYKWEKEHIEELLVDLERAFIINFDVEHSKVDASNYTIYYMGPIVLYEKDGAKHIIDGQQRLTSLTLLLIFLNNLQKKVIDKDDQDDFDTLIYSKVLIEKTFNLEIPDRTNVLKKLFFANFEFAESDYINNDSSRNIIERYIDIETLFPPRLAHIDILPLFIYWIQHKLMFTEIKAFNDENAYTIFETMNDRGLQLSPTEMLKSYLLMKVIETEKITELDSLWKSKMVELRKYDRVEEDSNFFKAWLRAKYATNQEKGVNDFERIGNRFHYWVKDNDNFLGITKPDDYYFFVKTDFQFYVNLYLKIRNLQKNVLNPEHKLRLSVFKGVAPSLSIPLILSTITVADDEATINAKLEVIANYNDNYAIFRLFLNESIIQSSIDYTFNNLNLEIRNKELSDIEEIFKTKYTELVAKFKAIDYLPFDRGYSKYILSRIYKYFNEDIPFEDMYFQRKKDSLVLYKFFKESDIDKSILSIQSKLKEIFLDNLVSYCLVPKSHTVNYDKDNIVDRINLLIRNGYLPEFSNSSFSFDPNSMQQFFINRNKALKATILKIWSN
jgi:uncharacterized protein with ParB-like and HNH nuclease domain